MIVLSIFIFIVTVFMTLTTLMSIARNDGRNGLISALWTSALWGCTALAGGWFS